MSVTLWHIVWGWALLECARNSGRIPPSGSTQQSLASLSPLACSGQLTDSQTGNGRQAMADILDASRSRNIQNLDASRWVKAIASCKFIVSSYIETANVQVSTRSKLRCIRCIRCAQVHAFLDPADGWSLVHMDLTTANIMWDPRSLTLQLYLINVLILFLLHSLNVQDTFKTTQRPESKTWIDKKMLKTWRVHCLKPAFQSSFTDSPPPPL